MQDDNARDFAEGTMNDHRVKAAVAEARQKGREDAMRPMLEAAMSLPQGDVTRVLLLGIIERVRLMGAAS